MHPPSARRAASAVAIAGFVLVAGCGGDDTASTRAQQGRDAAANAGLGEEVQDFFALATTSATSTYQVTYPNETGDGRLVVTQDPPNRRVDLVKGTEILESRLVRGEVGYTCLPEGEARELRCERTSGRAALGGTLDPKAIEQTVERLRERAADYTFEVTERALLGVKASCLVTERRAGAPDDPASGQKGTICLSPEGALLVVQSGDRSVAATGYTTAIPDGIFDLPTPA